MVARRGVAMWRPNTPLIVLVIVIVIAVILTRT